MSMIYLCQIPEFSNDYKHVADFSSRESQLNFMRGKTILQLESNAKIDNFTSSITLNYGMNANIRKCDYLFAQGMDGKYLFFFIDNVEQVTTSTVKVYLTLDVWQSYHLDIVLSPSYVVRQHVKRWNADGTPSREIVSENFPQYEYISQVQQQMASINNGSYIYVSTSPLGLISDSGTSGGGGDTPKPDTPTGLVEIEDENGVKGMFPCASGRFTNVYPNYNDGTPHGAVDLSGNDGVNIYPPRDNMTVVKVVGGYPNERNDSIGYGNYCVLEDNETKQRYWFGHMRTTPLVQVGDTVNQNTVLGNVGTSGYSTGPHLHYEIRVSPYGSNNRINPIKYIYSSDGSKHEPKINETFTRGEK